MADQPDTSFLLARALTGPLAWDGLAEADIERIRLAAADQGVAPLLWERLTGASGLGASLRGALEPDVRAAAARDLLVQRELQVVLEAVSRKDVDVLITKGTALAYTIYPEPWLRPRVDTDLLVRREDLSAASAALESLGYGQTDALSTGELVSRQIALARTDDHNVRHVVDLHWKIVNPHVLADALTFEDLWNSAQAAPALGPAARVPSTVLSAALGCVHRLAHHQGYERLIWLYDLKLLTAAMNERDWVALRDLARERGIASLCLDGLRMARTRLEATLPQDVQSALALAAPNESSRAYVDGPVTKRDVLISDMRLLRTWRERLRLAREHAFPPAAFMRHRYGHSSWPLPALYAHRLITGATRWIRS